MISPSRATCFAKTLVKLSARDSERVGDRPHSKPLSGNDGNREISFFMGDLHGFPENLVLQRLPAQDPLQFPDRFLEGFDLL